MAVVRPPAPPPPPARTGTAACGGKGVKKRPRPIGAARCRQRSTRGDHANSPPPAPPFVDTRPCPSAASPRLIGVLCPQFLVEAVRRHGGQPIVLGHPRTRAGDGAQSGVHIQRDARGGMPGCRTKQASVLPVRVPICLPGTGAGGGGWEQVSGLGGRCTTECNSPMPGADTEFFQLSQHFLDWSTPSNPPFLLFPFPCPPPNTTSGQEQTEK